MQYRNFKLADKEISLLGFGTMRFPVIDGDVTKIDEEEAIKMLRYAIDQGLNYVDTAYVYHGGNSEVVTGKALKDGYREKVLLADKMPLWLLDSKETMEKIFDEQFKRLDVDCIDMYLVHNITKGIWQKALEHDLLAFLERKKAEGKIKHIGFSFHDDLPFFKEIVDFYPWEFCQIQLNYMDQNFQQGVEGLKYADGKGIPIIIMEPLKGGKITDVLPYSVEELWESTKIKRTPAQWAFKWVADFPEVLTILSGMSNMDQVKENLETLSNCEPNSLTDEEKTIINKVSAEYNKLIKASCTACNYCLPCPVRINIPDVISRYNDWYLYNQNPKIAKDFDIFVHPKARPSICTGCRKCEKKCPQQLPIARLMNDITEVFGV